MNKTINVVVLEDDNASLKLLKKVFKKHKSKFTLHFVDTLKAAGEMLQSDPPDVIIASTRSNDGDPYELLKNHNNGKSIPLILTDKKGSIDNAVLSIKSGASDYFPLNTKKLESLPEAIEEIIGKVTGWPDRNATIRNLGEQNEFLADIIEALPYPFLVVDPDNYKIKLANSAARESSINPGGEHCYNLTHGRDKICTDDDIECPVVKVKHTGKPEQVRHTHRTINGNKITVEVHAIPIHNREGKLDSIIEYLVDITESTQTEERYRSLFENMEMGIFRSTTSGEIVMANPAFLEMLGFKNLDELKKYNAKRFYKDKNDREYLIEAVKKNGYVRNFETSIYKRDGDLIVVRESSKMFKDEHGIEYIEGTVQDITDIKRAEEQLIQAKNRAEENSRIKTSLLSNMSHEFRTPINGIMGFAQLLREELEDEEQKDMIEKIMASSNRLMKSLNSVLSLSELESGKLKIRRTNVSAKEIVNRIMKDFDTLASAKNIFLKENFLEEPMLYTDRELVTKVLKNLVDNAIKYTKEGGVTIETETISDASYSWVVFRVKDTGIGIDREMHEVIFNEFRQASEGLSRIYEGTGLGLTLSKKMIELLEGKIILESQTGKGSVFTILIPKIEPKGFIPDVKKRLEDEGEKKVSSEAPGVLPETLLVEDNFINRDVAILFLKDLCRIDWAEDGQTAINMAKQKNYDLILMDINLGKGMSGLEAAQEIRKLQNYTGVPIVAVTGYAMPGDKEVLLSEGCDYYLEKPFDRNDIHQLIREIFINE